MKKKYLVIFFLLSAVLVKAQKPGIGIVPLRDNEAQRAQFNMLQQRHAMMKQAALDTMELPFFDDFSYIDKYLLDTSFHGVYAYDTLWMDHNVFVNATMTDSAPSLGVATFDGLDEHGRPYDRFATRGSSEPSDTLTSRPIDMHNIAKGDTTVFFSFYYQPWGLGVAPKEEDTLLVEFKYPVTDTSGNPILDATGLQVYGWKHIWATTGMLPGQLTVPAFRKVMIQLHDTSFYKGFQFRFCNYANRTGNLNHWSIDYVTLDRDRKKSDSGTNDIAIQKLPTPILNDFYLMPSRHLLHSPNFINNFTKNLYCPTRNNGTDSNNTNTNFKSVVNAIFSTNSVSTKYLFSSYAKTNSEDVNPFSTYTFFDSTLRTEGAKHANIFNSLDINPLTFLSTDFVTPPPAGDDYHQNDYSMRAQTLTDLYAYDDGSAEAGIGLINVQSGQMAVEYSPLIDDVMRGVLIHFNESEVDESTNPFSLVVWQSIDLSGAPGQTHDRILLQIDDMHASYVNWPNGYVYVEFDTVLPIAGTFYVGWMQSSDFVLNVGLDRNFDEISQGQANPHIYYNVDGSWKQNTEIHGAPMIRPVMGSQSFAGIEGQKEITNGDIHLFPNPSNGKFRLSLPDNMKCEAGLYSLNGEELFAPQKLSASSDLDYSSLSQGIYLLKVSSASNVWWKKVIIQ